MRRLWFEGFAFDYQQADNFTIIIPHWFAVLIAAILAAAPAIPPSRLRQFSLRTLLIAMALLVLLFAYIANTFA